MANIFGDSDNQHNHLEQKNKVKTSDMFPF